MFIANHMFPGNSVEECELISSFYTHLVSRQNNNKAFLSIPISLHRWRILTTIYFSLFYRPRTICTHFPSVHYINIKVIQTVKPTSRVSITSRYVFWFFSKISKLFLAPTQSASRAHSASYLIGNGGAFFGDKAAWCFNVATKFYRAPNLIIRGTVLPLSHTP